MKPAEARVAIEHRGKVYQGSYIVGRRMITVSYGDRQIVAEIGPHASPATLARMILREMVGGVAPEKA
jgi:hypothetical protein